QTVLDGGELLGCDLHARDCPAQSQKSPLVLTRPNRHTGLFLLGVVALVLSFMAMPTRLKVGVGLDDREPPSHASCRTTARRCG
ncbi:MAG: hypothetical protein KBG45_07735, partial [Ottowia sp.]|nr:hypothetical protein [Ottowia sp.]